MSDDPNTFLPLHPLELRILLALGSETRHGYALVKEVEGASQGKAVFPANLYRRIRDLLRKGLVAETAAPPGASPERRKYFLVTALGRSVARAEVSRLEALLSDAKGSTLLAGGEQ